MFTQKPVSTVEGTVSTTPLVIHSKKLELIMLIFLVVQVRRWVLDVLNPSLAYSLLSLLQQCYIQLFTVYFQWISTDHDSDRDWLPRILQMFGCVFLHSVWVCLKTKWTPPQNLWGFERITRITHHPLEFSDIPKTVPEKTSLSDAQRLRLPLPDDVPAEEDKLEGFPG